MTEKLASITDSAVPDFWAVIEQAFAALKKVGPDPDKYEFTEVCIYVAGAKSSNIISISSAPSAAMAAAAFLKKAGEAVKL